ncbi:ABC transporter substrate-binding protein [Paenibacillus sp. B01]|uniref:ABC transporter substrate-binding protein n=1 Tax=Paenibacillus sp. B01 TaxID=2660554 RepID=UPI00129A1B99|nr:ABC transporter substrate-binding protein [Paenibacillus sp. B01]QGG56705.1 ABC transporter substrate-binding protein [Paenibacillus sp. B01]
MRHDRGRQDVRNGSGAGFRREKRRKLRPAVAAALIAVALAGCAGAEGTPAPSAKPAGAGAEADGNAGQAAAQAKDSLILAVGSEPETGFDPVTGWGRYGSPLFQSTLLKRDDDLNIVNDLATGYEVSGDGLEWTVKLRGDAVFTDGVPVTAEDVAFTFEQTAKSGAAVDLTNFEAVEAPAVDVVVFRLHSPQSTFVSLLVSTGIVPKHAYGPSYAEQPIGSGPFQLVQWDKGQQLIVEANPDYYGRKPSFKRLTFLFLGEDAAFAAAKAGEADVAYIPSSFSRQPVAGMTLVDVKSVDNRGIQFPYKPAGGKTSGGDPIGNDVTSDPAIRKAVNAAIDRQALVDGVLDGYGSPAYSPSDGLPWWNPDTTVPDGDPAAARQLLEQGGWSDPDGDGILDKDGQRAEFTLLYPAGDVTRQSLALAAADMVRAAGIEIRPDGKSWEEIEKRMHADATLFGWGSHDPLEMDHLFRGASGGVGYYNAGYYANKTVDAWMDKALAAPSETEALEFWKKAQWDGETGFSALGDAPWAWLVNLDHLYLVSDKLDVGKQRIQPHGHGWPITDNIADWTWKS